MTDEGGTPASGGRWSFTDDYGTFVLSDPERTSYLYFPLANEEGMMSSITPELQGDAKTSQSSFLLTPVTVEESRYSLTARSSPGCVKKRRMRSARSWDDADEQAQDKEWCLAIGAESGARK